ncbi:MAG TPA: hypothetical protein VM096_05005 [Vicinamibacterales bacterium]|nr:hypothetical protein [Vicinamibacterales bacterium]
MSEPRFERIDAPMPAWRSRSTITASVAIHAAPIVALLIFAALPTAGVDPEMPRMRDIARIELPRPDDPPLLNERVIPPEELSGYDISGLPFNLAKIDARRASLFPFLTGDLSFIDRMASDIRSASTHLKNPLDPALTAKPLALDARLQQQVVDEAWSRRDRWQQFSQIRALLIGHDAHTGDAPRLMRAYLDQNLLQPYCDGRSKDGQFWALLENSTEYVDFLEFIRSYARTRSSSRTTTELLFLMDELAQGNREVAQTVLATSVSHDLALTATMAPNAALLAARIGNDLRVWLASHRYTQHEGVGPAYDQVRLRILSTIVETSPDAYRESDARFLAGEIFFRQGNIEEAMQWWGAMRPRDDDSYATAAHSILAILQPGRVDVGALRSVLWRESARWHDVDYARLKQFGYRCDSY